MLTATQAACRWAWKHKGMGEHDPAERMVLPKVRNARHVYLSRAERMAVNFGHEMLVCCQSIPT